jgi:hypothetical protein
VILSDYEDNPETHVVQGDPCEITNISLPRYKQASLTYIMKKITYQVKQILKAN